MSRNRRRISGSPNQNSESITNIENSITHQDTKLQSLEDDTENTLIEDDTKINIVIEDDSQKQMH